MSNTDEYHLMSDKELIDRVEQGEMQTSSTLHIEFMRRMHEQGASYKNTFEDIERWKADISLST